MSDDQKKDRAEVWVHVTVTRADGAKTSLTEEFEGESIGDAEFRGLVDRLGAMVLTPMPASQTVPEGMGEYMFGGGAK